MNDRPYAGEAARTQYDTRVRGAPSMETGLGQAVRTPPGELESIAAESESLATRADELAKFVQTILSRTLSPRPERADEGARGSNYAPSVMPSFSARLAGNHCEMRRALNEAFDGLQELGRALGL